MELVLAGVATLALNYFLTKFAFIALIGFGFYQIIRTRSYPMGVTFLILGLGLWFLSGTIKFLFWIIGLVLIFCGILLLVSKRGQS